MCLQRHGRTQMQQIRNGATYRHNGAALSPAPGANQQDFKHFLSLPVPVLSPGVRVQLRMEKEEDAEEQDHVYTVPV